MTWLATFDMKPSFRPINFWQKVGGRGDPTAAVDCGQENHMPNTSPFRIRTTRKASLRRGFLCRGGGGGGDTRRTQQQGGKIEESAQDEFWEKQSIQIAPITGAPVVQRREKKSTRTKKSLDCWANNVMMNTHSPRSSHQRSGTSELACSTAFVRETRKMCVCCCGGASRICESSRRGSGRVESTQWCPLVYVQRHQARSSRVGYASYQASRQFGRFATFATSLRDAHRSLPLCA